MNRESGFAELLAPHVGGEVADRLVLYAELLERWAGKHSLVSFVDRKELVERHILDALAAEPCLGGTGRLLDVGSGAGLPGVPLLAARPEWEGVLLEPRQKRWALSPAGHSRAWSQGARRSHPVSGAAAGGELGLADHSRGGRLR